MNKIILQGLNTLGEETMPNAINFVGDPTILILGIILIIATVIIIWFVKKIIVNAILGLIGWAILLFIFKIELPFLASLIVSLVFGLAGIGALLLLKFLGII